jgi:hypothetical protein
LFTSFFGILVYFFHADIFLWLLAARHSFQLIFTPPMPARRPYVQRGNMITANVLLVDRIEGGLFQGEGDFDQAEDV